jgi:hypothetical protein
MPVGSAAAAFAGRRLFPKPAFGNAFFDAGSCPRASTALAIRPAVLPPASACVTSRSPATIGSKDAEWRRIVELGRVDQTEVCVDFALGPARIGAGDMDAIAAWRHRPDDLDPS